MSFFCSRCPAPFLSLAPSSTASGTIQHQLASGTIRHPIQHHPAPISIRHRVRHHPTPSVRHHEPPSWNLHDIIFYLTLSILLRIFHKDFLNVIYSVVFGIYRGIMDRSDSTHGSYDGLVSVRCHRRKLSNVRWDGQLD